MANVKAEHPAGGAHPSASEVLRYASEVLHAIHPQPPPVIIADVLAELKAKLTAPAEREAPPKDLQDALSKIEAKVGKMDPAPKVKPDFKATLEAMTAKPPPPVKAIDAPDAPKKAS